ncbi:hypothetical protein HDV00_012732 [Rhizophlyctis rosea]|nr:hypothetical protein HDV00_012732 [Rhizophlyctis rosea]
MPTVCDELYKRRSRHALGRIPPYNLLASTAPPMTRPFVAVDWQLPPNLKSVEPVASDAPSVGQDLSQSTEGSAMGSGLEKAGSEGSSQTGLETRARKGSIGSDDVPIVSSPIAERGWGRENPVNGVIGTTKRPSITPTPAQQPTPAPSTLTSPTMLTRSRSSSSSSLASPSPRESTTFAARVAKNLNQSSSVASPRTASVTMSPVQISSPISESNTSVGTLSSTGAAPAWLPPPPVSQAASGGLAGFRAPQSPQWKGRSVSQNDAVVTKDADGGGGITPPPKKKSISAWTAPPPKISYSDNGSEKDLGRSVLSAPAAEYDLEEFSIPNRKGRRRGKAR